MAVFSSDVTYEVIELIAEGGMGAVYKAIKKGADGFEKIVAIKTMLEHCTSDEVAVKRFMEEAKMVANLVHENIVQIYQLDKNNGEYFFVLEFVDGIALFDFIEFHNKLRAHLPPELAVFIASRIARGLDYAHTRRDSYGNLMNIVHCDVCPHNILITREGLPKLTDFGIAKGKTMTDTGKVSGKLLFMSPEQARGEQLDFRSDIYSLGTVLFYMLSGQAIRPANDDDMNKILKSAQENHILWELLPDTVTEELLVILRKMLASDVNERYQQTSELARDLEYFIYKSGYGPTIVTLADYMHKVMPSKFSIPKSQNGVAPSDKTVVMNSAPQPDKTAVLSIDKTTVMSIDKTVPIPGNFFHSQTEDDVDGK